MAGKLDTWTPATTMLAILLAAVLAFISALASEQKKDIEFRSYGGRFSHKDADDLAIMYRTYTDNRIFNYVDDLKREDRRLQCQIDRLVNHPSFVTNLHPQSVKVHDRIDLIKRPVLPFSDRIHDPIGDG